MGMKTNNSDRLAEAAIRALVLKAFVGLDYQEVIPLVYKATVHENKRGNGVIVSAFFRGLPERCYLFLRGVPEDLRQRAHNVLFYVKDERAAGVAKQAVEIGRLDALFELLTHELIVVDSMIEEFKSGRAYVGL